MDKLPKLSQKEVNDPNSTLTIKDIEILVKNFPDRKHQAHMAPLVNSTEAFHKKITKSSRNWKEEHFSVQSVTPTQP